MSRFNPPVLDDRDWDRIRAELLRRIPVHAPDWTDHDPSDPGIALLELFAWLASDLGYRMNRLPDRVQLELLDLLDLPRREARAARAWLTVQPRKGVSSPVQLAHDPVSRKAVVAAGPVQFQLTGPVVAMPLLASACVKAFSKIPEEGESSRLEGLEGVRQALESHLGKKAGSLSSWKPTRAYQTWTFPAVQDGQLPPAVPVANTVDEVLWVALLMPDWLPARVESELARQGRVTANLTPEAKRHLVHAAVRDRIKGLSLSVAVRIDDELCGADDGLGSPDPGAPVTRLPLLWEIAAGASRSLDRDGAVQLAQKVLVTGAAYRRLKVAEDPTGGLAGSGIVRLLLPRDPSSFGTWFESDLEDPALLGMGTLPPLLEDDTPRDRVLTWIRCRRPEGTDQPAPPRVRWVGLNVVGVEQAVSARPEYLGYGRARPGQSFVLASQPVLSDGFTLQVHEVGGDWVTWTAVDDLRVSRPNDPHYVLDCASGTVRFGDGVHARMPMTGEQIRVLTYKSGGGVAGNVPAGAIAKVVALPEGARVGDLEVNNPFAAEGGRDAEETEAARDRIPEMLRHRDRAVAAQDFVDLARQTPAADIARAHVLPRHRPQERVDGVPGVVTLVVIPGSDPLHPDEPVPSRTQLQRVCQWLEPRRLVTTELFVTPPQYVPVWVSVAVEVEEGFARETVFGWVELAVRQYLAPLPPYGPAGEGWAFGRDVQVNDVEAAVLRVQGVRRVLRLRLEGYDIPALADARRSVAGSDGDVRVVVETWQLPVVRQVLVTDDAAAEDFPAGSIVPPGTSPTTPSGGGSTPDDIPVPIEVEVC